MRVLASLIMLLINIVFVAGIVLTILNFTPLLSISWFWATAGLWMPIALDAFIAVIVLICVFVDDLLW